MEVPQVHAAMPSLVANCSSTTIHAGAERIRRGRRPNAEKPPPIVSEGRWIRPYVGGKLGTSPLPGHSRRGPDRESRSRSIIAPIEEASRLGTL